MSDDGKREGMNFGMQDWVDAYRPPVPETFVHRRALADRLASIGQKLIRADISDAALIALETQLASIEAGLGNVSHYSHAAQYPDMLAHRADKKGVMMAFDYDAVTGLSNPAAPRLHFLLDTSDVEATVTLESLHEGGPGNAHGGVLAAMLDVVLARIQHREGWIGVTGYLNVRYLLPTPLYQPLTLKAWAASRVGRITKVQGGVWLGDIQTVSAEAMYVVPRGR